MDYKNLKIPRKKQSSSNVRIVLDLTDIEKFKEVFLYELEKEGGKSKILIITKNIKNN